jgi:NDP-sugar pyrophosphorylase family protein
VQMVHPSVFAGLPLDEPAETIHGVYRQLIAERPGSIRAFLAHGDFLDVGSAADYLHAALAVARRENFPSPQIGAGSRVDRTAQIIDSVIWDNVNVGAGARLERCVVADGVSIGDGALFRDSAIIQGEGKLIVADLARG